MRIVILLALMLLMITDAQASNGDFMQNIGKIYVVIAVILLIFVGISAYLIRMDKKVKKLENIIKNEQ